MAQLERQQEEAVEAEDFEAAASLDAELERLGHAGQALQQQLKGLDAQVRCPLVLAGLPAGGLASW